MKLGLNFYIPGCNDKVEAVHRICSENNLSFENVLFVGDDLNDLQLMKKVGFSCCPKNAISEVKAEADYVSSLDGGAGVIREIADYLLASIS